MRYTNEQQISYFVPLERRDINLITLPWEKMAPTKSLIISFFVSLACVHYTMAVNFDKKLLKDLNKEELNVLEHAVKRQGSRILKEFDATVECEGLECVFCVGFELAEIPHQICLTGGIDVEVLGAYVILTYDDDEIWDERIQFNTICTGLPKPLNKVGICLEAYNVSLLALPDEAAICLRTELTLIFPLLSIDFNCLKYAKGRGVHFDWSIESESKALIDININGGKPIVSFNSPIPWELIEPIVSAIQEQRQKLVELQHELMQSVKENIEQGNWWDAFVSSWAAGATMGMGIRNHPQKSENKHKIK